MITKHTPLPIFCQTKNSISRKIRPCVYLCTLCSTMYTIQQTVHQTTQCSTYLVEKDVSSFFKHIFWNQQQTGLKSFQSMRLQKRDCLQNSFIENNKLKSSRNKKDLNDVTARFLCFFCCWQLRKRRRKQGSCDVIKVLLIL